MSNQIVPPLHAIVDPLQNLLGFRTPKDGQAYIAQILTQIPPA